MDTVEVAMLPELVETSLEGRVAVVIDVLRATTTVTWALAQRAERIYPCEAIEEARELAQRSTRPLLLGGERGGEPIEGFDLGNSPSEYSSGIVNGRRIAFTTTNGTRAMLKCGDAAEVLLAAFTNLSRVVQCLREAAAVTIVCSGTNGVVTAEDVLLAGAITEPLLGDRRKRACNDQARLAVGAWREANREGALFDALLQSQGGRNLARLGRVDDVEFAAACDQTDVVGRFDSVTREIKAC